MRHKSISVMSILFAVVSCHVYPEPVSPMEEPLYRLGFAIERYREMTGRYPEAPNAVMTASLKERGLLSADLPVAGGEVRDAWGRAYVYKRPAETRFGRGYLLYSTGPDGIDQNGDDVILRVNIDPIGG
ncbi:MAG: type II secretion system protein GspG [Planctomycetes bacterium]|nr:type II secretion system protein GspG [Planctomycetota bacterium]